MSIVKISNDLKVLAINVQLVNQASFGDIQEYNNKATIMYPYVNFDVVSCTKRGGSKVYTFRIYVCDRNTPYAAYNKTELILNNILNNHLLQIETYTANYFSFDFKDNVHGVWADFQLEIALNYECSSEDGEYNLLLEDKTGFIVNEEDESFIKQENN